jgi:hypothetical protein
MEYPTYYRAAKAPRKPLLGTIGRLTLLSYFGLTMFALGSFSYLEDDLSGFGFHISGLGGFHFELGAE